MTLSVRERLMRAASQNHRFAVERSVQTGRVNFPDDPGLVAVLVRFGVRPDDLLGQGGEAWVYALDADRVVRVLHSGGTVDHVRRRQRLIEELIRSRPAFDLPDALDVGEIDGRVFVVERRLAGRSLMAELRVVEGSRRARLIEAHLEAAAALG